MLTKEQLNNLKVGQQLFFVKREKTNVSISKIGNKYFYCGEWQRLKFDIETGREITDYMRGELYINKDAYKAELERAALERSFKDKIQRADLSKFTTEQLQNILNQLNPAQ